MSLAVINNNPGNIKQVGDPETGQGCWKGSRAPWADRAGHAIFLAREWGLRAVIRQLARYAEAGDRSLVAIMRRYSPASDTLGSLPGRPNNRPDATARAMAAEIGIAADVPLDLFDARGAVYAGRYERLAAVLRALAHAEDGRQPELPDSLIHHALYLYLIDYPESGRAQG